MNPARGDEPAKAARTRLSPASGRKGTFAQVTTDNPVDQHVGQKMRERRLLLGLSRIALAQQIGVTAQQYDKYERAKNRLSASRLFDVARSLKVSVTYFFEDMSEDVRKSSPAHILAGEVSRDTHHRTLSGYERRQIEELIRLWELLPYHARSRVVDVVRSMMELHANGGR